MKLYAGLTFSIARTHSKLTSNGTIRGTLKLMRPGQIPALLLIDSALSTYAFIGNMGIYWLDFKVKTLSVCCSSGAFGF